MTEIELGVIDNLTPRWHTHDPLEIILPANNYKVDYEGVCIPLEVSVGMSRQSFVEWICAQASEEMFVTTVVVCNNVLTLAVSA